MNIGNIFLKNPVIAAPLAGISDRAYREIAKTFGCGLIYSEMLSSMALVYQNSKTKDMLAFSESERPINIQLVGWRPDIMAEAARIVEASGAEMVDINAGCSVRKVIQNREGADLLRDLPRAREIISSVVKSVKIPVTLKMRKAWSGDYEETLNFARMAQEEGVSAIAIHGRTPQQHFSGTADREIIKLLKSKLSIPVIGNGDIKNYEDARNLISMTGCDGIMIGRASMGNPWIFSTVTAGLKSEEIPTPPSVRERMDTALKHAALLIEYRGELIGFKHIRKHLAWYIKGLRGATRLREHIFHTDNYTSLLQLINEYLDYHAEYDSCVIL